MMLLNDIANYLQLNGIGTNGVTLFQNDLPEVPDNAVAIYEYAGEESIKSHNGEFIDIPYLMVMVRGATYDVAEAKMSAIRTVLDGLANTVLSGTMYLNCFSLRPPVSLGMDDLLRTVLTQNYKIMKAR